LADGQGGFEVHEDWTCNKFEDLGEKKADQGVVRLTCLMRGVRLAVFVWRF